MSIKEIKKLFEITPGRYVPCGLNFKEKLWWRLMPGKAITVRWPTGWVVLHDDGQGGQTSTESADPNDHYRPWLEKYVGRQKWDWDWGMANTDVIDNTLTIKFRKSKEKYISYFLLQYA